MVLTMLVITALTLRDESSLREAFDKDFAMFVKRNRQFIALGVVLIGEGGRQCAALRIEFPFDER